CGPIDTATISVAAPFSLSRIASSTAISSNGFIDILTLASSTPDPSGFTRTLTLKSTTRLTGTRIFMPCNSARRANYGPPPDLSTRAPRAAGGRRSSCHKDISGPHALEQRHARRAHHQDQQRADAESADMRPPGGIALLVDQNVPDLDQDPEAEHPGRAEP